MEAALADLPEWQRNTYPRRWRVHAAMVEKQPTPRLETRCAQSTLHGQGIAPESLEPRLRERIESLDARFDVSNPQRAQEIFRRSLTLTNDSLRNFYQLLIDDL